MAVSAAERRFIMAQLGQRAKEDMIRLWDAAGRFDDIDFANFVVDAFPDLANGAHQLAAEVSATLFEEDFPAITAVPAPALPQDQLRSSAQWALGADGTDALTRLGGTLQRAVFDGDRQTTVWNAEANGMRWIRQAQPGACAFCRLLATRTTFDSTYRTEEAALRVAGRSVNLSVADRRMIASGQMTREEALARRDQMFLTYQIGAKKGSPRGRRPRGSRPLGEKYHDDCNCTAKAIPVGREPMDVLALEEPDYAVAVEQWRNEYEKASDTANPNDFGSGETKAILREWRTFGDDIA